MRGLRRAKSKRSASVSPTAASFEVSTPAASRPRDGTRSGSRSHAAPLQNTGNYYTCNADYDAVSPDAIEMGVLRPANAWAETLSAGHHPVPRGLAVPKGTQVFVHGDALAVDGGVGTVKSDATTRT